MPTLDTRLLRRNPAVEEAPLQGEMMLFDAATSKFYVLNRSMAVAWRCCDGQHSVDEIASKLAAEFSGVSPEQAAGDVARAIDDLRGLGLILDAS